LNPCDQVKTSKGKLLISKQKMRFSKKSVGFTPHLALKKQNRLHPVQVFFWWHYFPKNIKADEHEDTTNKTKEET